MGSKGGGYAGCVGPGVAGRGHISSLPTSITGARSRGVSGGRAPSPCVPLWAAVDYPHVT